MLRAVIVVSPFRESALYEMVSYRKRRADAMTVVWFRQMQKTKGGAG
jgi:hypothetical protein